MSTLVCHEYVMKGSCTRMIRNVTTLHIGPAVKYDMYCEFLNGTSTKHPSSHNYLIMFLLVTAEEIILTTAISIDDKNGCQDTCFHVCVHVTPEVDSELDPRAPSQSCGPGVTKNSDDCPNSFIFGYVLETEG